MIREVRPALISALTNSSAFSHHSSKDISEG
jgi:hypothetical protein